MPATYILPIRTSAPACDAELTGYLRMLAQEVDLIAVDGSPPEVFTAHAEAWGSFARHMPPAYETPMGKVGGVLTGVERARHERLVIADDDVRYDRRSLRRVVRMLDEAEVVRPQNYFDPLPWHARWDTGRILLNRLTGGDWPGTLAVRRSALIDAGGYRGDVMFENLELVRTIRAGGGREALALDLFVRRRPPSTRHFWSQRVRQAYDEFARPRRMALQLALLPIAATLLASGRWKVVIEALAATVVLAEAGRRRAGGDAVFRATAPLWAPLWLVERAVTSWLALGARLLLRGIPYGDGVLETAASSLSDLRARQQARSAGSDGPHP